MTYNEELLRKHEVLLNYNTEIVKQQDELINDCLDLISQTNEALLRVEKLEKDLQDLKLNLTKNRKKKCNYLCTHNLRQILLNILSLSVSEIY